MMPLVCDLETAGWRRKRVPDTGQPDATGLDLSALTFARIASL